MGLAVTRPAQAARLVAAAVAVGALSLGSVVAARRQPVREPVTRAPAPAPLASPPKRLVVNELRAPAASRARSLLLEILSEHAEIEVVGHDDVSITARRLGLDARTAAGKRKLAAELQVDAWLDGEIDDALARFVLSDANGETLSTVTVRGGSLAALDSVSPLRVWDAIGPWLSEPERRRRALLAQQDLAVRKLRAREGELARQATLAAQRRRVLADRLQAQRRLALDRQAAFAQELARQERLAHDRRAAQAAERARAERLARQEASLRAQQQLAMRATPWQPARTYAAAPSPPQAVAPVVVTGGGVSPATARWLAEQRAMAPQSSPDSFPPAAQPGPTAIDTTGVSPATRRWLEQQGVR